MKPIRDRGENLCGDIPPELRDADHLLTRYGRWATSDSRGSRTSMLGRLYIREADRKESLEAYQRRRAHVPSEPMMAPAEAMLAQRALARVADRERVVLTILYVPQRLPIYAQLRVLRIPPALCRTRHLAGLRMFDTLHRLLAPRSDRAP